MCTWGTVRHIFSRPSTCTLLLGGESWWHVACSSSENGPKPIVVSCFSFSKYSTVGGTSRTVCGSAWSRCFSAWNALSVAPSSSYICLLRVALTQTHTGTEGQSYGFGGTRSFENSEHKMCILFGAFSFTKIRWFLSGDGIRGVSFFLTWNLDEVVVRVLWWRWTSCCTACKHRVNRTIAPS